MHILNLLEDLYDTEKKEINLNRDLSNNYSTKNSAFGGASYVTDKKTDPFLVRKTSHDESKSAVKQKYEKNVSQLDGYWIYIDGIINNNELKSNPFLPRVYNVKKIKASNGKIVMRCDLEKLETYNNIDTELLINYIKSILHISLDWMDSHSDKFDIISILSATLIRMIRMDNYEYVKNDKLLEALKYISSIVDMGYELDLHSANIMWRRGPYGIQMVIIDPIGLKTGSYRNESLYDTFKEKKYLNRNIDTTSKSMNVQKDITSGDDYGNFSSIQDKKSDPFMVRKTSNFTNHYGNAREEKYDAQKNDGYWTYIDGIINNDELKSNPFCPRVYNIKTIIDKSGKKVYRADIEKLQPLASINTQILANMFLTLFSDESKPVKDYKDDLISANKFINECLWYLDSICAQEKSISNLKNEKLIELIKYIQSLNNKFAVDMNIDNCMLRLSPHGPQLVITDPLAGPL